MGAGAGYTITLRNCKIQSINSISIDEFTETKMGPYIGHEVVVDCDIDVIGDIRAESYMYSCDWIKNVPMTITSATLSIDSPDGVTEKTVEDAIREGSFNGEGVYGGGYIHSTFDGEFEIDDIAESDYWNDITGATVKINHPNIIQFIELAVTGDNKEYEVRFNNEPIEGFEDEDEAIEYLKQTIREVITESGIDSIDFSDCTVEELFWEENVDGEVDIVTPWYDNIRYCADTDYDEFEEFADNISEISDEIDPDLGVDEDFDI